MRTVFKAENAVINGFNYFISTINTMLIVHNIRSYLSNFLPEEYCAVSWDKLRKSPTLTTQHSFPYSDLLAISGYPEMSGTQTENHLCGG